MRKKLKLDICAHTDCGFREVNEDSFVAIQGHDLSGNLLALLGVADGIGGMGNGHVASSTSLTTLAESFRRLDSAYMSGVEPPVLDWLSFCFQKANAGVLRMGLILPGLKGMGATCTAAAITRSTLYVCHIGDSRAYLWRQNNLKQLTVDDWYRELRQPTMSAKPEGGARTSRENPAKQRDRATLVTQAIGWQPMIRATKLSEPILPGDAVLLCTDGLTDSLSDAEISDVLSSYKKTPDICRELTESAAEKPGSDNVTVVLARL